MKFRIRRKALTATLAAVALTAIAVPVVQANADTEAAETKVNTLTWNIEGGYNGTYEQQVDEVMNAVGDKDPDFLVVNELCDVQYDSLKKRLVDSGWTSAANYARFSKMDERKSCTTGDHKAIGFGLFSKHNLNKGSDETQLFADPHSPGRSHFLTCVTTEKSPDVRLCGTHLVPNTGLDGEPNDSNVKQTMDLEKKVASYLDKDQAVIMAGDYNARPNWGRLDRIYSKNVKSDVNLDNFGSFRELDDNDADHCLGYGAGTTAGGDRPGGCNTDEGVKIDLIFASENHITGDYNADVLPMPETCGGPCSDHFAVNGTVTLTV